MMKTVLTIYLLVILTFCGCGSNSITDISDNTESYSYSIVNDGYVSFTPREVGGVVLVYLLAIPGVQALSAGYAYYITIQDCSLSFGNVMYFKATQGALSGTTGDVGDFTVSACQGDGKLYFENRMGSTYTVKIVLM